MAWINFNGQILDADLPLLRADNRAFAYGDGLFETMQFYHGECLLWNYHLDRITKGCRLLGYTTHLAKEDWLGEIRRCLASNNLTNNGARVKWTVFRNAGGRYTPTETAISYLIECEPMLQAGYPWVDRGLRISICQSIFKTANALSAFKTNSALTYVLAGMEKTRRQLDDLVLLNQNGSVCEGISANLFIIKNKKVFTPPLSDGCVAGTMRAYLLDTLPDKGIDIAEETLAPDVLQSADALFLSNAVQGIIPVQSIDDRELNTRFTRFIHHQVFE